MQRRTLNFSLTFFANLVLLSTVFASPATPPADGAKRFSGIAYFAAPGECVDAEGDGSDYALTMTGDLLGCHYVFVEVSRCSSGRAYYESGTETFVGLYNGGSGTFRTNYVFTGSYLDCQSLIGEIAGRCQHPIQPGSGTGVFEGVRGRLDMLDDVEAGNFPYRGHLMFGDSLVSANHPSLKDQLNFAGSTLMERGGC